MYCRVRHYSRVLLGFWQASNIGRRMNQIGYWNPTLGTSVGVAWPNMDEYRPELQIRSPYGFYPVLADVEEAAIESGELPAD